MVTRGAVDPPGIAEGNEKRGLKDRGRFVYMARGSALKCAAIHDVLVVSGGIAAEVVGQPKVTLKRIVAMWTCLAMRFRLTQMFAAVTLCSVCLAGRAWWASFEDDRIAGLTPIVIAVLTGSIRGQETTCC